jgi:hypothetical protein
MPSRSGVGPFSAAESITSRLSQLLRAGCPSIIAFCFGWPFPATRFPAVESRLFFLCSVSAAAALFGAGVRVA